MTDNQKDINEVKLEVEFLLDKYLENLEHDFSLFLTDLFAIFHENYQLTGNISIQFKLHCEEEIVIVNDVSYSVSNDNNSNFVINASANVNNLVNNLKLNRLLSHNNQLSSLSENKSYQND